MNKWKHESWFTHIVTTTQLTYKFTRSSLKEYNENRKTQNRSSFVYNAMRHSNNCELWRNLRELQLSLGLYTCAIETHAAWIALQRINRVQRILNRNWLSYFTTSRLPEPAYVSTLPLRYATPAQRCHSQQISAVSADFYLLEQIFFLPKFCLHIFSRFF